MYTDKYTYIFICMYVFMYVNFTKSSMVSYAPRQYLEYFYPITFNKSFNIDSHLSLFNGASASQSASQLMTGRIQGCHIPRLSTSLKHLKFREVVNTLRCLYDFIQYQTDTLILS